MKRNNNIFVTVHVNQLNQYLLEHSFQSCCVILVLFQYCSSKSKVQNKRDFLNSGQKETELGNNFLVYPKSKLILDFVSFQSSKR